jgi:hypothetical protein
VNEETVLESDKLESCGLLARLTTIATVHYLERIDAIF